MNTLNTSPLIQTISNTTSLSNGILKKLAITLAVSAIGVSTLVPVAYAEGEVVAQPGDIITVNEDIYGISGNFAEGGTLTVKNGGASSADQLREAAGDDATIGLDELFNLMNGNPNSVTAKTFKSLMGDKIDADGNMKVDDILTAIYAVESLNNLPITKGMTWEEVNTLFTETFGDQADSNEIRNYINQLDFDKNQVGQRVYGGFEDHGTPTLVALSHFSNDDFRYRLEAVAKIADSEGNVSYENFKDILPSVLFHESSTDGDSDTTTGYLLLAKFQEEATDGKLSIGDAWKLGFVDSDVDKDELTDYTVMLNHAGKDLLLTKTEFESAVAELNNPSAQVTDLWNGLQSYTNSKGEVEIPSAFAYLNGVISANDFLDEDESEHEWWNDNGRIATQNVSEIVNEAFGQDFYHDPNNGEVDFAEPYVDPQKVITKLGSADANGTYDANAVYGAILDVYMAEWQVKYDEDAQPNLDNILEESGSNGRISIDDYITLSGLSGTKEEAVRVLLESAADDAGTVSAFDAYYADNNDDLVLDIYTKTDVSGAVSVREIIKALPDGISSENKDAFEEQLEGLTDENGTITRETAKEKLTEFVLANPGNELERIEGDGYIRGYTNNEGGYTDDESSNLDYIEIGIDLKGEKDITLNNEVEIYADQSGISVTTKTPTGEFKGDVSVVNSGDIGSAHNGINLAGKNVTLDNTGDIDRNSNYFGEYISSSTGISATAEDSINITNTGEISVNNSSVAISSLSDGGDITIDNDGDLFVSGYKGNGIQADSGINTPAPGEENVIKGGNVKLTNSGTIRTDGDISYAIATWSNGGKVEVINSGKLTTLQQGSTALHAYSGTNKTLNGRTTQVGDAVNVSNSGVISTEMSESHGIFAGSYGGAVEVNNSQKVTTKGDNSTGIRLSSGETRTSDTYVAQIGGNLTLNNSAAVSTAGNKSEALRGWTSSGDITATNEGKITTTGEESHGIKLSTDKHPKSTDTEEQVGGDITLTNKGAIETTGKDVSNIRTYTNGGNTTITNEANLTATGKSANGIKAYSGHEDDAKTTTGDNITINNTGEITVSGDHSNGIDTGSHGGDVKVDNSGDVSAIESGITLDGSKIGELTNSGKITVKGIEGAGMSVEADDTATLNNTGNVEVEGLFGMAAVALNSAKVENSGKISLAGDLSNSDNPFDAAISAYSFNSASIKNSGDVTTSGNNMLGLYAENKSDNFENPEDAEEGTLLASIINSGKISTTGDGSTAISASSGENTPAEGEDAIIGSDVSVENSGVLSTEGEKAHILKAWSNGGDVTITNEAKLTATGIGSEGINANSGHYENGEVITEGGDVKIENSGDVTANGGGIYIDNAKNADVVNSGNITATGVDSGGIAVIADETATLSNTGKVDIKGEFGLGAVALNSASVENTGDVSLVRNWSKPKSDWNPAILAFSPNDASLKNSGKVTVDGDNMVGLYAGSSDYFEGDSDTTKKATLENSGIVTTSGNDKAHAAYIKLDGTGTLTNTGSLITEGKTNAVVVEGKGDFTLDNSAAGVIEAKDGLAIVTEETTDKITNLGTIKGGADFAAGDDVLDNKGVLAGRFDFGDGKDTLTVSDFSKVSEATFDGGASDDIITLSGGGEIAKDQIVNFETANFLSGDFSGDVMDKFTKMVNVETGASISGFTKVNNLTSKGSVSVAAGDTLNVTGDLNIEGGKFNLGVDSTSNHAVVNVAGDASFASTSNLFINVAKDGTITQDESVSVLNGKTLTFGDKIASTLEGAEGEFEVDDDYISYDFSGRVETTSTGKSLILTARDSIGSTIEAVGEKFGGAIEYIAGLSDDKKSEQNSVLTELETMIDKGQVKEAQELMNEVVSSPGASNIASTQNTNSFTAGNMVINRAAARIESGFNAALSAEDPNNILGYNPEYKPAAHIRNIMSMSDEGTETSIAATGYNGEIWMQVYGVRQQNNGIVSGDTDVFGGAAGIDFLVDLETVFGLGLVYSTSDSDADTANAHTDLETDSFGITAYGMTRFADSIRLGGALAYYWNDHDLKRQVLANQMSANYDSTTFVARAEIGREFAMDGYTFMPQIGAIYTHNSTDAYTETGPLAQSIGKSETDSFIGSVGFVVDSQQDWDGMIVRPELHMNVLHEFNDELGSFAGTLATDNTVSVSSTITSLEETRFNIGGGLKLNHTNAFASELAYDGIFADDTQEHVFRYKASYKY